MLYSLLTPELGYFTHIIADELQFCNPIFELIQLSMIIG
jgi:hypothetical protein